MTQTVVLVKFEMGGREAPALAGSSGAAGDLLPGSRYAFSA